MDFSRIFIKNFNETGKNGKLVCEDALTIIRANQWEHLLTEEHAKQAMVAFEDVLGKESVTRGQDDFLDLSFYNGGETHL